MPTSLSSHTSPHLCPNLVLVLFSVVIVVVFNVPFNWAGPTPPLQSNVIRKTPNPVCSEKCDYEDFFNRAKCDKRNLYQVPLSPGCEDAKLLELQENHITHVHVDNFSGYGKVRTLDISSNQISTLQPGLFITMGQIKNLLASHNRLTEIPNGTFSGTESNLLRLYLNGNQISEINEEAFRGLRQVITLYLDYNLLKALPPTVLHDVSNLQHLSLSKNKLIWISPITFRGLENLQQLILDSNELTSLPDGLFTGLDSLCTVDLSHNNLVSIPPPESLGLVGPLQVLKIEANNMTKSHSLLPYLDIANRIHIAENRFILDCDFVKVCLWYFNKSETELSLYDLEIPLQCDECANEDMPHRCESRTTDSYPTEYASSSSTHTFLTTLNVRAKKFPDFDTEFTNCTSEIYQLVIEIRNILVYCAIIVTLVFTLLIAKMVCDLFKLGLCWKGQENRTVPRSVKASGRAAISRDGRDRSPVAVSL